MGQTLFDDAAPVITRLFSCGERNIKRPPTDQSFKAGKSAEQLHEVDRGTKSQLRELQMRYASARFVEKRRHRILVGQGVLQPDRGLSSTTPVRRKFQTAEVRKHGEQPCGDGRKEHEGVALDIVPDREATHQGRKPRPASKEGGRGLELLPMSDADVEEMIETSAREEGTAREGKIVKGCVVIVCLVYDLLEDLYGEHGDGIGRHSTGEKVFRKRFQVASECSKRELS